MVSGAEKSGRNAQGDSWWETWQETFREDEWRWGTVKSYSSLYSLDLIQRSDPSKVFLVAVG